MKLMKKKNNVIVHVKFKITLFIFSHASVKNVGEIGDVRFWKGIFGIYGWLI